jgi:hypothetical protein
VRSVPQTAHCAPARGDPQLEQYLPVAGDWQEGHTGSLGVVLEGVGLVMREL